MEHPGYRALDTLRRADWANLADTPHRVLVRSDAWKDVASFLRKTFGRSDQYRIARLGSFLLIGTKREEDAAIIALHFSTA